MLKHGVLPANGRVVLTTGDLYRFASSCTEDFEGGEDPLQYYARSKVGTMWQCYELHERLPQLSVCVVHPGIIVSDLHGSATERNFVAKALAPLLFLNQDEGAQAQLVAATQDIHRGKYLHNTYGWLNHNQGDPAIDTAKAKVCVDRLDALAQPYL